MVRSFIEQAIQIYNSDVYDDTLTMANSETSATNIEDDLNYLRTQEKLIVGRTNWFDPPEDNFNLKAIHDKKFTYWIQKFDDVTVPNGQNYVTLSSSTKPSYNIAYVDTTMGAITSKIDTTVKNLDASAAVNKGSGLVGIPCTNHGFSTGDTIVLANTVNYNGTFTVDASSSTNEIVITATYNAETFTGSETATKNSAVGSHSLAMKVDRGNVCEVRDADTNEVIWYNPGDGNKQPIYALLQVGSLATDGNAFADSGTDQGQLSFVYFAPGTESVTAVPNSAIQDKKIEYAYRRRTDFYNLPENAFDQQITFVESIDLTTIDLQDVYDNDSDGKFSLSAGKNYTINLNGNADYEVVDGATSIFLIDQSASQSQFNTDVSVMNGNELKLYEAGNGNYMSFSAPALASDLTYTLPATYGTNGYVLTTNGSGTLSWSSPQANVKKAWTVLTSTLNANTSLNISGFTSNPDSMTFGSSGSDWAGNYDVYLGGQLLVSGADSSANHDVYWVDASNIAFEFNIVATGGKPMVVQVIERK